MTAQAAAVGIMRLVWLIAGLTLLNTNTVLQIWLVQATGGKKRVTTDIKHMLTFDWYQAAAATA